MPGGFLSGDEPAPMLLNGSFVRYTACPTTAGSCVPDWRLIRPNEPIIRRLAAHQ
jgi:hypothetical protein